MLQRTALAAALTAALAAPAVAQTCPEEPVPLRHFPPGGQQLACPCFAAGEEAGVTFTAPPEHYPIEVLKVRIAWGAALGSPAPVAGAAVHLYGAGLPNPGAPQLSLAGPVLTSGVLNEYDVTGLPGSVVASGPFSVTLEFGTANAGMFLKPSVVSSGSCKPGVNLIRDQGGSWLDACAAGVTGNWVFEVTYRIGSCQELNRDVTSVSVSAGGSQRYTLAAGASEAGKFYWILGSLTGTSPGVVFPSDVLPLVPDIYTQMTLTQPLNPLFGMFVGALDPLDGHAFASFDVPAGADPSVAGLTLFHAYITVSTPGEVDMASNAVALLLAP